MKKILKFTFILFLMSILLVSGVYALGDAYCVRAEVSDVSPSSIGVDEEFTVGIQIENCGGNVPEDIYYEIISMPSDIIVKENLITEIPRLEYSNSERFITYHMRTTNDAKPGTHVIKTRLSYNVGQEITENDHNITVTIIADEAELDIASVKTKPVLPYEGDVVEMTMRIENFGDGSANSVRVYLDHPFQGIKEYFIGTLTSNEDGPALFTFIANGSGDFEFPLKINYKDDFGDHEINTNLNLMIIEEKTDWSGIISWVVVVIVILGLIFFYFRTKRAKDKIIHQLLKNGGNHKVKKKR